MFPKVRQLLRKRTRKQAQVVLTPVRYKAAAQSLWHINQGDVLEGMKEVGNILRALLALGWEEACRTVRPGICSREAVRGTVVGPAARPWMPLAFSPFL